VAGYFLDTSALAKLYHKEPGSDYVEQILDQPDSKGFISRLSLVEFEIRTGDKGSNWGFLNSQAGASPYVVSGRTSLEIE
jgi:PIN domain nuclease of toxin-antitoxin system